MTTELSAEQMSARLQLLDGIPDEVINSLNAKWANCPLKSALAELIETADLYDINYAEDTYPDWLINLAGGISSLNIVLRMDETNEGDESP